MPASIIAVGIFCLLVTARAAACRRWPLLGIFGGAACGVALSSEHEKAPRTVFLLRAGLICYKKRLDRKPGSVLNDDLSWFYVAAKLRGPKGPSRQLRDVRGFHICPIRLLLLTGFT